MRFWGRFWLFLAIVASGGAIRAEDPVCEPLDDPSGLVEAVREAAPGIEAVEDLIAYAEAVREAYRGSCEALVASTIQVEALADEVEAVREQVEAVRAEGRLWREAVEVCEPDRDRLAVQAAGALARFGFCAGVGALAAPDGSAAVGGGLVWGIRF